MALSRKTVILCALFLLAAAAVRLAQPILDGDLFWHMAYARQMLERHSLILDWRWPGATRAGSDWRALR
jgi:hypothetical protein